MDDADTLKESLVTRTIRQLLLYLVFTLWMVLHLLVAMMVVLVSSVGRMIRWLGRWRTDLGMDHGFRDVRGRGKERLWPPVCEKVEECEDDLMADAVVVVRGRSDVEKV